MTMQTPEPTTPTTPAPETPDTPVVEPGAPKTPGETAKEAQLSAELRARAVRTKRKSDELHAARTKFEQDQRTWAESREAENKKRDADFAALQAEIKELKSGNPLLRKDVDANGVLKEFLAAGTPEAQVIDLRRQLEAQKAAFEARFEELGNATKARQEEEQRRLAEIDRTREESNIRQLAIWVSTGEKAKACPHLNAEFNQDEICALTRNVVDWAKKNNKRYSGDEIVAYLESHAKTVYKEREGRRSGYFGSPEPASAPAVTAPKVSPPGQGNGASRKPSGAKTFEEEAAEDLLLLRKATAADAVAAKSPKKR